MGETTRAAEERNLTEESGLPTEAEEMDSDA
jgi:hypothetical protein